MNLLLLEPSEVEPDGCATLQGRRLLHAREVLKASAGDVLRAGVVNGRVGNAEVLELSPERLRLKLSLTDEPPPRPGVDLLLAIPRPKALKKVLPSVASLGVDRVVLVNAARVEKSYFDSKVLEPSFLRGLLLLGAEQAKDARLPEVLVREPFKPFVEDELDAVFGSERTQLVAHPSDAATASPRTPVVLAIGPEGGWVNFELELLKTHGFTPFSAGPRTLRVETAVPYLLGQLQKPPEGTAGCRQRKGRCHGRNNSRQSSQSPKRIQDTERGNLRRPRREKPCMSTTPSVSRSAPVSTSRSRDRSPLELSVQLKHVNGATASVEGERIVIRAEKKPTGGLGGGILGGGGFDLGLSTFTTQVKTQGADPVEVGGVLMEGDPKFVAQQIADALERELSLPVTVKGGSNGTYSIAFGEKPVAKVLAGQLAGVQVRASNRETAKEAISEFHFSGEVEPQFYDRLGLTAPRPGQLSPLTAGVLPQHEGIASTREMVGKLADQFKAAGAKVSQARGADGSLTLTVRQAK